MGASCLPSTVDLTTPDQDSVKLEGIDANTSYDRMSVEFFEPTIAEPGSSLVNAESSDANSTFSSLFSEPSGPLTKVNSKAAPQVGCARTNWIFKDRVVQFRQELLIRLPSCLNNSRIPKRGRPKSIRKQLRARNAEEEQVRAWQRIEVVMAKNLRPRGSSTYAATPLSTKRQIKADSERLVWDELDYNQEVHNRCTSGPFSSPIVCPVGSESQKSLVKKVPAAISDLQGNNSTHRGAPSIKSQPFFIFQREPHTVSVDCAKIDASIDPILKDNAEVEPSLKDNPKGRIMSQPVDVYNFAEDEHLPPRPTRIARKRVRYAKEEYVCKICDYKCMVEASLFRHATLHMKSPFVKLMYSCEICGLDSKSEEANALHQTTHKHGSDYKCDLCIFKSGQLKKLIQHRRKHTQERPHVCNLCTYCSTRRDNLHSHARRIHKIPRMETDTFTQPNVNWAAIAVSVFRDLNNNF